MIRTTIQSERLVIGRLEKVKLSYGKLRIFVTDVCGRMYVMEIHDGEHVAKEIAKVLGECPRRPVSGNTLSRWRAAIQRWFKRRRM